jgi:hypothetical protein
MRTVTKRIGVLLLAVAAASCGGSINGNGPVTGQGGQGGGTTTIPCSAMGACECTAASDRCTAQKEACWCPSECDPQIQCICGGGRFLGCEDRSVIASCVNELSAVQAKCAGEPFLQYLAQICVQTNRDPNCTAACLANLNASGSCAEIDCSFCPVCDCAGPATPSPLAACLQACSSALPEQH